MADSVGEQKLIEREMLARDIWEALELQETAADKLQKLWNTRASQVYDEANTHFHTLAQEYKILVEKAVPIH